ncbi:MAG: HlyD family efflux transporter periplasmic adaptor subunit [Desulfobacteraceae bacterium]|nr:MAG: HlyD family efflux transporter periplasmic adaptor subunit [Desulfobacteraceae bacterium]
MKRFKIILLVALLVAAGVLGWRWWAGNTAREAGNTLRLYGHIEIRDAQLAFKEQERIAEVLVEEGDRVAAGRILARLDTQRLNAQIREAEAQAAARRQILNRLLAGPRKQEIDQARSEFEAAQVRVANARRNYERIHQTAGAGASSEQALDNAKALRDVETAQLHVREKALQLALEGSRPEDIAEARSRLEAAQATLELLQIRLADAVLKAPVAGVVRSRILEPGEMADPGRPVLTLSLTDPKWVRAYVPEPMLGHIRPGMPARVISDSFPERPIEGWIGFISPQAEFTPKNVETTDLRTQLVYEVRIYVRDEQDRLRLGMPVSVEVDRPGWEKSKSQSEIGN